MQTFTIHKGVDMIQNPSSFNTFAVDYRGETCGKAERS